MIHFAENAWTSEGRLSVGRIHYQIGQNGLSMFSHRSWQPLLGPKKSPSQSIHIGPKIHIVAKYIWHYQTKFWQLLLEIVVGKVYPICQNWRLFWPKYHQPFKRSRQIFLFDSPPCSHNMYLWFYISRFAWTFFWPSIGCHELCPLKCCLKLKKIYERNKFWRNVPVVRRTWMKQSPSNIKKFLNMLNCS